MSDSWKELKISRNGPGVSHLFADDSLLFFKATSNQAHLVKQVLNKYEMCNGQLLSPSKCSLLLGKNCDAHTGDTIAAILNVTTTTFDEKYLGLPVSDG